MYQKLTDCYLHLERWDAAEVTLRKQRDHEVPQNSMTLVKLGYVLLKQNRRQEAIEVLTQVPMNAKAYNQAQEYLKQAQEGLN